jgi:hypothetical protein
MYRGTATFADYQIFHHAFLTIRIGDEVAVGLPKLSRLKDVSVNVSLLFTLVMVDVSNICEERFGRPQMSQFQDMFLKPIPHSLTQTCLSL